MCEGMESTSPRTFHVGPKPDECLCGLDVEQLTAERHRSRIVDRLEVSTPEPCEFGRVAREMLLRTDRDPASVEQQARELMHRKRERAIRGDVVDDAGRSEGVLPAASSPRKTSKGSGARIDQDFVAALFLPLFRSFGSF